eukprot:scaffold14176_cov50-Prasinocladus_malaysianus.AAC.1
MEWHTAAETIAEVEAGASTPRACVAPLTAVRRAARPQFHPWLKLNYATAFHLIRSVGKTKCLILRGSLLHRCSAVGLLCVKTSTGLASEAI